MTFVTAIFFLLAFLPSLTWLLFYLKEDPHPEPPRWLWLSFFIGLGAAPASFYIEKTILKFSSLALNQPEVKVVEGALFMFLGIALVEELVKFFGARLLLLKNPVFDEPVDAMIYMVTIALGFAAFENILILNNFASQASFGRIIQTLTLRFIGANFLHTLASGIIGYYWARGIIERNVSKRLLYGIALATILHGVFNLLIISLGANYLFGTTLFLFVVGLLVLNDFEILKQLKTPATLARPPVKPT